MGRLRRATCIVHLISAPSQQGRNQMYHYIEKAKSLLSKVNSVVLKIYVRICINTDRNHIPIRYYYSVATKKIGDFVIFLWPSQNV